MRYMRNPFESFGPPESLPWASPPELATEKVEAKAEPLPIAEAAREVGVVEDMAKARVELEEAILSGKIHRPEWVRFWSKEIRPKYPGIKNYGKFFLSAIDRAFEANADVGSTIAEARGLIEKEFLGKVSFDEKPTPEVEEKLNRALFQKFFVKEPVGKVEVQRGIVSLDFVIDDKRDFAAARRSSLEDAKTVLGFEFVAPHGYGLPITVIRRSERESDTPIHEREHAKNAILAASRERALDEILRWNDESWMAKAAERVRRWQGEALSAENWAKDEIIAWFAGDASLGDKATVTDEFAEYLTEKFTNPSGHYYKTYFEERRDLLEKDVPIEKQKSNYKRSVERGLDVFARLATIYNDDMRLTIGLLEQFPLHRWPAVVRLITMRHRKEKALAG